MAEIKLVKMVRDLPLGETGATTADVHPAEVANCQAEGWRVAKGKPIAVVDPEPELLEISDAAKAASRPRKK